MTEGWSVGEAIGMIIAWAHAEGVDSMEAHVEGETLIVKATKVDLSPVTRITFDLGASVSATNLADPAL